MAKYRQGRINDEMQKEVSAALRNVKDPRVSNAFITVTAVQVTPDLKYAKVYYSFLQGDAKAVATGLKAAAGFIRHHLATTLNLRITPELSFYKDESVAYGAHIAKLIEGLTFTDDAPAAEDSANAEPAAPASEENKA